MMKRIPGTQTQNRIRSIRYTVTISLLLVLISALQTSFFTKLQLFGTVPDLMLCTVLIIACSAGQYAGAISGIAGGFLVDALGSVGISILPLLYFLIGYLSGCYVKYLSGGRITGYLSCLGVSVAVREIRTIASAYLNWSGVLPGRLLLHTVLPEAAGSILAGLLLFYPLSALMRWIDRK